ncbi:hypothetical protein [Lentzea flava]|uniref:Uncharacterized protein n=1 Tax=Lentzea flava TaxID=103732 RepID=A0ABQ2U9S2_9PSEU|nr:hypothetical protein [Lentzea flava]MCP2196982.1 hypothetical protein [Lentzea flava]GGU14121.1 hypothetical protein GCM10010178_01840 [Lentzea flava]
MTASLTTQIAYPDDVKDKLDKKEPLTPDLQEKKDRVDRFNRSLTHAAGLIPKWDGKAARYRIFFMLFLGLTTAGGTFGLLWAIFTSPDLGKIIGSAAVTVSGLLLAGLVNPLQTMERDIIFRRWADMITMTFLVQAADPDLTPRRLTSAADKASARFAALAGSYAAVANKTLEVLKVDASAGAAADEEDEEDEAPSLTVQQIAALDSVTGEEIKPITITAEGADDLKFTAEGLAAVGDVKIADETKGVITGTVGDTPDEYPITVKVQSAKTKLTATTTFTWTVKAAPEATS